VLQRIALGIGALWPIAAFAQTASHRARGRDEANPFDR
jgi:hypothetical protein